MHNKIDFLALQVKLNLTSFCGSFADVPSFITLNLSKNGFTTLYTAHVMFIPTPCTQALQYIYIIDSLGCKIKLPVVYNDKDGFVFYIDDAVFNALPSNFYVICVYADKAPDVPLIQFFIEGESFVARNTTYTYQLRPPKYFPANIVVIWKWSPHIHATYSDQLKIEIIPTADFTEGIITAEAFILGYRMYTDLNLTRK